MLGRDKSKAISVSDAEIMPGQQVCVQIEGFTEDISLDARSLIDGVLGTEKLGVFIVLPKHEFRHCDNEPKAISIIGMKRLSPLKIQWQAPPHPLTHPVVFVATFAQTLERYSVSNPVDVVGKWRRFFEL